MSIYSTRPRAFRTRNPGRDAETDEARFGTIRNAITMAKSDARRERDGLFQRLEACGAVPNLDHVATPAGGQSQQEAQAQRRLAQLDAQIRQLSEVETQLDRAFAGQPVTDQHIA